MTITDPSEPGYYFFDGGTASCRGEVEKGKFRQQSGLTGAGHD